MNRRWLVLAAGFGVMMVPGTSYSWSVFARPCAAFFGWSSFQVSLAFALLVAMVGIGAVSGGVLCDRYGSRALALGGIALWGCGNLLAGLGTAHFGLWWLCLTYGVIGGFGIGITYVAPTPAITKWFPDERGLASGILLFGFGAGSMLYNNVLALIPAFATALDHSHQAVLARNAAVSAHTAFVPNAADIADVHAVMAAFVWSGVAFLVLGGLCALLVQPPPPGYAVAKAAEKLAHERDMEPREVLHTGAFYGLWTMTVMMTLAGMALFGNAISLYAELAGVPATVASIAFGWLSILNGVGRLAGGWISDLLGRMPTLVLTFLVQAAAFIALPHLHSQAAVALDFAAVFSAYGSLFGILPAVSADFFGTKYMGENYGFLISGLSVGGLFGPTIVGIIEDQTGNLLSAIVPFAWVLVLGALLPLVIRKPAAPATATA